MKLARLVFYGLAAFVVILLLAMLVPVHSYGGARKIILCRMELSALETTLNVYHEKFGAYPSGKQSEIVKSLLGDNSQKYQFLHINFENLSSNGEYLDPWKTPYAINFPATNSFVVSSAGKDRIFGNADDIIFNSVSNDFAKP